MLLLNGLRTVLSAASATARVAKTPHLLWSNLAKADTSPTYINTRLPGVLLRFVSKKNSPTSPSTSLTVSCDHQSMPRIVRILGFLAAFCTAASTATAQSLSRDAFEGPEIALHGAGGDANFRIEGHARVAQAAHSGQWCERVTVRGTNGTSVYMAYPVPPARVISELAATVWLKADRPGLQWIARVTLPRSIDPDTGKPLSTLLRGAAYTQVGVWQQLSLGELPQALDRQTRVLRAQYGRDVDPREAYVDRLLINVYGGPGVTNVWVDDLEIAGAVPPSSPAPGAAVTPASMQTTGGSNEPATGDAANSTAQGPAGLWPGGGGVPTVERSGSLLLVGGKPFFPRVIEHQGEPPARLKALGFNALWVGHVPTAELLRDAASAGIWIIGLPPPPLALESRTGGAAEKIGPQFDGVLVWDLGHGLVKSQLEGTRRWAKLVHSADPRARPMLCGAESDLTAYTRPPIHLLLAKRDVLGTTLRLENYSAWLRERAQLAMTGTTLWAAIASQPSQALIEQTTLLGQGQAPQLAWQESQLRTLVHAALAGGARGLYFQSRARLDANDAQSRRLRGDARADEYRARVDRALAGQRQLCHHGRLERQTCHGGRDRDRPQPLAAADVHSARQPTGHRHHRQPGVELQGLGRARG